VCLCELPILGSGYSGNCRNELNEELGIMIPTGDLEAFDAAY